MHWFSINCGYYYYDSIFGAYLTSFNYYNCYNYYLNFNSLFLAITFFLGCKLTKIFCGLTNFNFEPFWDYGVDFSSAFACSFSSTISAWTSFNLRPMVIFTSLLFGSDCSGSGSFEMMLSWKLLLSCYSYTGSTVFEIMCDYCTSWTLLI